MKNNITTDKNAFARLAKNACRAMAFALSGIGVPLVALSRVH